MKTLITSSLALFCALLLISGPSRVNAQGALSLSTVAANNGQVGVSFDITATKSTKIHRFWVETYSGSNTIEVWANPNGSKTAPGVARTTGWVKLGDATFNAVGSPSYDEIPFNVNLLMNPGETWGFILWRSNGTMRYRTGVAPFVFSDTYISIDTQGWGVYGTAGAFTFGFYPRQFCGKVTYDPGCFFPDGVISYELLDANLQPTTFSNIPGSVNVRYVVAYPDEESTVSMTLNLRNVQTNAVVYSYNFSANKLAMQTLTGIQNVPLPNTITPGYYKAEVVFNTKNSCMNYADFVAPPQTLLLLPPGAQMCVVWPGDTDNNGIVNYADRAALNRYIFDANMRSTWLQGPNRYSVVGGFDYLEWKAQPSAPWNTPDGCYKDTDGNGVINNFDYIAIKLNWLKNNTVIPAKGNTGFSPASFDMDQNYPNPFNPSTTIRYSVPERSHVRLVVTDMLGRTIGTLVDGEVEEGVHSAVFDGTQLPSGNYVATVHMTGNSGLTFSKSLKMTLNK
ncbi:MAG TPA: T9SS type A sorting domain-containing protein [Bacteroidota bacterium]|nr:T9SS type A sorting domain-containing protein [Bacteroidota bacterium]